MSSETTKRSSVFRAKAIALIGLMAAVTCVLGPLSIPIPVSPVPISLTNLALYFTVYVIGMKRGTLSYIIYLLIGFVGVPVFSGFTAGPGKLLGPTGGYLIGFIPLALICGFFVDRWPEKRWLHFIGMVAGTLVCYLFGSAWLAYQGGYSFAYACAIGMIPYLPGDLAKIIIALILGPQLRKRLHTSGLI